MITQAFDLNLIPGGVKPVVKASQYDANSRTLSISLFAGVSAFPVPSGAQVLIQGTKQDGTGFQYECTAAGNIVTADVTQQMTAFAGPVEVELQILSGGEVLGTGNFILQVEQAALADDTIISETDIPIIQRIPEYVAEAQAAAEEAALWNDNGGDSGSSVPGETNNAYYWAMQAQSESARHRIIGPTGTTMPNEAGLQFKGMSVSDDEANGRTVVTAVDSESLIKETVGWTGKNLLPYPYRAERIDGNPITYSNVTYTSNSDGTLTASGTASGGNANYYLTDWRDGNASLIKAGTYTLSGCPAGGNTDTYCLILYCFQVGTTNGTEVSPVVHIYDVGNGATFTLTEDVWTRFYFRVANGATAPSALIKPMLRNADILNDDYEPYHNTVEEEINQIYEAMNTQHATGDSFALVPTSAGNALATTIYGVSTQDGTPTPSTPVAIESASADFKCVGKNLISYPYHQNTKTEYGVTFTNNGDGSVTVSTANTGATAEATFICHNRLNTETNELRIKNGEYILSGCPQGGSATTYLLTTNRTYNGSSNALGNEYGSGKAITLNGDDYGADGVNLGIHIVVKSGTIITTPIIFKPMLRLASVADATYEPYKHTDITTSLTLRSIEVTSSDPYNLVKDGHYYIADTIDWDEVDGYTLTQRIAHREYDGTEAGWAKGGATYADIYAIADSDASTGTTSSYYSKCTLSNMFIADSDGGATDIGRIAVHDGKVYFSYTTYNTSTLSDWKTFLGSNPLVIDFIKIAPTKTSLTSAQAKALLSMRTYDESTSIDAVNSPAPVMKLEYAKARTPALALTGHNMAHINAIDIGDM